jgi:hypothetical protein
MASALEELSPAYYGEARLRLTLSDPDQLLQAFAPVVVAVDYSAALPAGIVLPLEFTVTGPSASSTVRKTFRRFAPAELAFVPREGGSFLVKLSEADHNLWYGVLVLEIAGDRVTA